MPGRGHNGESGGRKSSGRASQHPSLLGKGNTTVSLISKSKQKKQENLGKLEYRRSRYILSKSANRKQQSGHIIGLRFFLCENAVIFSFYLYTKSTIDR